MASLTISTCEAYQQSEQKRCGKFCARKPAKKERRTRFHAKTAEVGCVLGAGEGCSRYGRVGKAEIRTKMHQIAMQHMKKENRRNPSVFAGFLAGAEGLEPSARGFGVDVETQQREQERGSVDGFSRRSHKRVVLVWCCKGFSRSECSQKTG